jgi:plasmid stabilization system protein ParE
MPPVSYQRRALSDIDRLQKFLAAENAAAGKRAAQAIRQGIKTLGKHPEIGRAVEGLPSTVREWVIEFGRGA